MRRELVVSIHDFLVDAHRIIIVERWIAGEHLENEDAQRPPIDVFVVTLRLDDLWCQVLWSAAESVSLVFDDFGETKIGDLDVPLAIN